jgi:hypothetical protein
MGGFDGMQALSLAHEIAPKFLSLLYPALWGGIRHGLRSEDQSDSRSARRALSKETSLKSP